MKRIFFKNAKTLIFDQLSKLRNKQSTGFTLLELMIVIAILATLAGIALPVYFHQIEKARITKAIAEIAMLDKMIMVYRLDQDPEAEVEAEAEIAILVTLAGISLPFNFHQIEKAGITKAIAEIGKLGLLAKKEKEEKDKGKGKEDKEKGKKDKEKIASPTDLPHSLADIGYENLQDPWGNPYQFANHADISPGQRRKYKSTVPLNTDYDLYSMGPDGSTTAPITTKAGYDDIIRASDGEYIGPASQF